MPAYSPQVVNDADFWLGNQDREHNLFFSLGFEDPALRRAAADLVHAYERASAAPDRVAALIDVAHRSQQFKKFAYGAATHGWVGWIYPTFIDHTHREIAYALMRIARGKPLPPRVEACFWTRIGGEHAAFAAHLADPTEAAAIRRAMQLAGGLSEIHNACMSETMATLTDLSRQAAAELDAYFQGLDLQRVKSIIHPVLAAHVVREGQRFVQTMAGLPGGGR